MQADFVLPSSREGILENRAWNLWLQKEVGLLLADTHSALPAAACLLVWHAFAHVHYCQLMHTTPGGN
jgi:hypothetical protein